MTSLEILFEDNHLIAVDKPAGMLTQPTDKESDSLETLLKEWIKEKYHKQGNVFLGVIHRLDRYVSGIVLFAKTSKSLSRLNEAMRSKELQKTYYALIEGSLENEKGTLEHFLKHDDYRSYVCASNDREGKLARLHYEVISRYSHTSLIQIDLETGRYHQIRAQCSAVGCPIVGDVKYGSRTQLPQGVIALHHARLSFTHPVTHVEMMIESSLPKWSE